MLAPFPTAHVKSPDERLHAKDLGNLLWERLFEKIKALGASDLHGDATCSGLSLRARIRGILIEIEQVTNWPFVHALIARLKEFAALDLTIASRPQEGVFSLATTKCRYRVIVCPSTWGESFVLRIINVDIPPSLDGLKLPKDLKQRLIECSLLTEGLMVFSGPTGSGKSTLIQAFIMAIDRQGRKVITIEDPVERLIPFVVHEQITDSFGFDQAIKSAMRQDPDVIVVGEIRDSESAQLACRAAETGHLVITTLHAKSLDGIRSRLVGLGVNSELLSELLVFASYQRLIRIPAEDRQVLDIKHWSAL